MRADLRAALRGALAVEVDPPSLSALAARAACRMVRRRKRQLAAMLTCGSMIVALATAAACGTSPASSVVATHSTPFPEPIPT